jgi:hypothetical protein
VADKGVGHGTTGSSTAHDASARSTADAADAKDAGETASTSGSAGARGLAANTNVRGGARAAVSVGGLNTGEARIRSLSRVVVEDAGSAEAASGNAVASGPPNDTPPLPSPTLAAVPRRTGASTPVDEHSTSNEVHSDRSTALVVAGDSTTPATHRREQSIALSAARSTTGTSSGTCTLGRCTHAAAASALPTTSAAVKFHADTGGDSGRGITASSGDAKAEGALVRNVVNTDAHVDVRVAGHNAGIIEVLIESITRIFNSGGAESRSGHASAVGSGSEQAPGRAFGSTSAADRTRSNATTLTPTSGNTEATGLKVNNRVEARESASIRVDGANYGVIDIFIGLGVRLFNWGSSHVTSDSAVNRSTQAARSVSARAVGLEADNAVHLASDVSVDVRGTNYGRISVHLRFETEIQNRGAARAASGDSTAGLAPSMAPMPASRPNHALLPKPTAEPPSLPKSGATTAATSGNALVAGTISDLSVTSQQTSAVTARRLDGGLASRSTGSSSGEVDRREPQTTQTWHVRDGLSAMTAEPARGYDLSVVSAKGAPLAPSQRRPVRGSSFDADPWAPYPGPERPPIPVYRLASLDAHDRAGDLFDAPKPLPDTPAATPLASLTRLRLAASAAPAARLAQAAPAEVAPAAGASRPESTPRPAKPADDWRHLLTPDAPYVVAAPPEPSPDQPTVRHAQAVAGPIDGPSAVASVSSVAADTAPHQSWAGIPPLVALTFLVFGLLMFGVACRWVRRFGRAPRATSAPTSGTDPRQSTEDASS